MAEEKVVIMKVGTDEAVKSIGELRQAVKDYRKALDEQEIGSESAEKALKDLTSAQNALRQATKLQNKEIEAAEGSYNALVKEMGELKKQWRATGDEIERAEIGRKISTINDTLKDMDASIGNYQRNVGSYKESFVSALTAIPGPAGKAATGVMGVNTAMKALSANPVGAIIAAVGAALGVVVGALKSSEENFFAVKEAMSIFNGVGQGVTNMLQWLGKGLANAATGLNNLLDKWGLLSERAKENQSITREEIALKKEQRELDRTIAEREKEISELRAKFADRINYSAQERLGFLREAIKLEEQNTIETTKMAEREYEVLKRKAELTGNSIEDNDELNRAYINMVNSQTNLNNKMREYNAQITEATNQMNAELKPALEEIKSVMDEDAEVFNPEKQEDIEGGAVNGISKMFAIDKGFLDEQMYIMRNFIDNMVNYTWEGQKREQEALNAKYEAWNIYAGKINKTYDLLGAWADAYADKNEFAAKAQKAIAIGQATVDTISATISAVKGTMSDMTIWPMSRRIAKAAANGVYTAALGAAEIAKLKSVNISKGGGNIASLGGGVAVGGGIGASVSAPAVIQQVPITRSLTSASEEERLNKMANDQRVYLVYSDVEQAGRQVSVQQAESAF